MKNNILLSIGLLCSIMLHAQIKKFETKGYRGLPINGGGCWNVIPVDLQNDGDLDFILLKSHEKDEVYINDGKGHFKKRKYEGNWQISGGSYDFAEADFNHDGKLDLLIGRGPASGSSALLDGHDMILLRETDSTFTEASGNLPSDGLANCILNFESNKVNYTMGVATGFFNKDTIPDIVMANGGIIYQILLGPIKPFDGQWIVCPNFRNKILENNLYMGKPDGSVSGMPKDKVYDYVNYSDSSGVGIDPDLSTDVAVADFNNDGYDDIFVTNFHHESLTWVLPKSAVQCKLYLNDTLNPGRFKRSTGFPSTPYPATSVASSDFDKDGDIDLFITMESAADSVTGKKYNIQSKLFINNGSGVFSENKSAIPYLDQCKRSLYDAHFQDMNGDGWDDIFCAGVESILLIQDSSTHNFLDETGKLPIQQSDGNPYSFHTYGSAIRDFNGDGKPDILMGDTYEQNRLLLQTAGFYFIDSTSYNLAPDGENNSDAVAGDLDNDGDIDIVASIYDDCNHVQSVNLNIGKTPDGTPLFKDASNIFPSAHKGLDQSVDLADINNDGLPEVIFAGYGNGRFYFNNGNLHFSDTTDYLFPDLLNFQEVNKVSFIDIDNDNDPDVFLANGKVESNGNKTASNALFLWDNQSNKYVDSKWLPSNNHVTVSCAFGDLNKDGWTDILAINEDDKMVVYLSQKSFPSSNPGYQAVIPAAFVDNHSGNAMFADFNQDGFLDIVAVTSCCIGGNTGTRHVLYLYDDTTVNNNLPFIKKEFGSIDFQAHALAVVDINFDGYPDVVTGDRNYIKIYLWDKENNILEDHTSNFSDINDIQGFTMSTHAIIETDIDGNKIPDLYIARDNQDILMYGIGDAVTGSCSTVDKQDIKIFPNPSAGLINVNLDGIQDVISMDILSLSGKILYHRAIEKKKGEMVTIRKRFPSGYYILRIQTIHNIFVKKLSIINK